MSYKKIFWGVILIAIGVLFILKNTGVIYFSWHAIWSLWPLLLILWGISMIPVKDYIKLILSFVAVALGVVFLYMYNPHHTGCFHFSCGDKGRFERFESKQIMKEAYDVNTRKAILNFDAAAGSFEIEETTTDLIEFNKDGDAANYVMNVKADSGTQHIDLKLKDSHIELGDHHKRGDMVMLKLNENPVWDFNFNVGAADIDFDLSKFKTSSINVDGGACSMELKLGDKYADTKVDIEAGASSIEIEIPQNSGCEIKTNTALTSKDFEGFTKTEKGVYRTLNFLTSTNKIFISIDAAVSSIEVKRY